MVLSDLEKYNQIVIQVHDNPDADAVGSGYAMYRYFQSKGKDVRLVYGGKNVVSKSNMKLMIAELDIPLEHIGSEEDLGNPELLLTVDCQYGQGNVQLFEAWNVAIIDHHSTGKQSDDMAEVRSHLISCATVCYALLKSAGFEVNEDVKIATALYYGLYMDSNQLSEINHPLDRDMVDFLQYDKALLARLKYANFSITELETAGIAITNNNYLEKYRMAIVDSEPCDPNILGVIGDFVIQVDSIDVCIIYNECFGGYKLSVRSCSIEVAANELVTFITAGIGNGGGHLAKAGGFISKDRFMEKCDGDTIESYLIRKAEEYYDGYEVVHYNQGDVNLEGFKTYRKKPGKYGYVKLTDIFPVGTECKIRTLEGDVFVTSKEDIFLMIGYRGEVYSIEKAVFERKYIPVDEAFCKAFEYEPSVINVGESKSYNLMPYARSCMSGAGVPMLAKPVDKYTKVFTRWEYEAYMVGNKGDMLCYAKDDIKDVYIVKRDIFDETYEEIEE